MNKSCQRHSIQHLFMMILLHSSMYYALGNLYKLEPRSNIWHEDILETLNMNNKIQCGSMCNQRDGCIGFGISSGRCYLFKSLRNEDSCEESCLDLPEIKIYAQNDFKITTTMTQIPSTSDSPSTVTTMATTTTTKKSATTTTESPQTSTTESPTTTTTLAPFPPPMSCGCASKNGYFNGMRANTRFYRDGAMEVDCQCMGNQYLYKVIRSRPTNGPVKPGIKTQCMRVKKEGIVGMYINYDNTGTKLWDYELICDEFYDGIVDTNKNLVVKSSAPDNKEVRCDDYQVMFGYQAIEQEDGTYDVRLECQPLIPR